MSQLRAPGLGPIVGHTTDKSCKIWVRADRKTEADPSVDVGRRSIGVLAVLQEGNKRYADGDVPCFYFRLQREFSRTGTITLGHEKENFWKGKPFLLKANTEYVVRAGILFLDDPAEKFDRASNEDLIKKLPSATAWLDDLRDELPAEESEARFRTFPPADEQPEQLEFLLGSCRYPGYLWKVRSSDSIFAPMAKLAKGANGSNLVLMVGDQIYADTLHRFIPLGRADTYEEFQERYVTAFGSPNIRELMRHVPTYMILDDHEIEDNWSQDRLRRDANHRLFILAIDAYMSYQWSHGPRTFGKRLYYTFDYGNYPFFVLDTRTQRYSERGLGTLDDNHMLGPPTLPGAPPGQLSRLLDWLSEQQRNRGNIPKFIASPSVFVPSPMTARQGLKDNVAKDTSDSWPAFPNTKRAVLRHIVENEIQNVVFLSGDIHCSNVVEMKFSGTPEAEALKAFSITSSAFYWPFPFADGEPSNYVHNSKAKGQEDTFTVMGGDGEPTVVMDYVASHFTQEDNFAQITVNHATKSLRVRFRDKSEQIIREDREGSDSKLLLSRKLNLEPW